MTDNPRRTEALLLTLVLLILSAGLWLAGLAGRGPSAGEGALYVVSAGVLFAGAHLAVRRLAPRADPLILPLAAVLYSIGFVLIGRLESGITATASAGAQARWLAVAISAFAATLRLARDLPGLARFRYTFAFGAVALLLLPLVPLIGAERNGARLWVEAGPLNFQPAEIAKLALVVFLAAYLTERREVLAVSHRRIGPLGLPAMRHFGPLALAWGISLLVIVFEKDLGSSLLFLAVFVAMTWLSTGRTAYLLVGAGLFSGGAAFAHQSFAHVQDRIAVWLDPFAHFEDRGYQLVQSMFALATGGSWGTGIGRGRPDLIPSVQTDFIFSAIGEELGLAGAVAVVVAFALLVVRGFGLALRTPNEFSKLLVAGLTVFLGLQTALIIGGVTRLIPLTGVTLPFVSYGGSSLLSNFILVALLIRASDQAAGLEHSGPPTELHLAAGGGR